MPDPLAGLSPRYLSTPEAARWPEVSGRTLENHRIYMTGPVYRKIGGRVVYRVDDLERWVDKGLRTSNPPDPGTETHGALVSKPLAGSERASLDPFAAIVDDGISMRDQRDLMSQPLFSLAKGRRTASILYEAGGIRVSPPGNEGRPSFRKGGRG